MSDNEPKIFGYDPGFHNSHMGDTVNRLTKEGCYKDQSVVMIIPALNTVATKAASSWLNLMSPPNGKMVRLFTQNLEVGSAYDTTIKQILDHPELSKFKYILTMESDNCPPPDGLMKLIAQMEAHPEFSCIGGLYFSKGECGAPAHIWGDISDPALNFRPQVPIPNTLMECVGVSMGFHLWRLDLFKDPRIQWPLFKTCCSSTEGCYSQDLKGCTELRKIGFRCAVDTSVAVGHIDMQTGFVW